MDPIRRAVEALTRLLEQWTFTPEELRQLDIDPRLLRDWERRLRRETRRGQQAIRVRKRKK